MTRYHHATHRNTPRSNIAFIPAFFCVLAMSSLAFSEEARKTDGPRIWTSNDGRTLEGTYVRADETKVSVRRIDGRTVEIPMALLAEEDRKFIAANGGERQTAAKPEARPRHLTYVSPEL